VDVWRQGLAGGGRTQQALNLEVGGRIMNLNEVDLLIGVRGSLELAKGMTEPAGPSFPIAALVLTIRI
jgi:hypothetical protein